MSTGASSKMTSKTKEQPETGAVHLINLARKCGVSVCFANPGTSEMHLVSALDRAPGIRAVLGLHETVCSGAADGFARMTQRPAMTLLHLGPGLANAAANLHNARRARSPVLNVVGDMSSWHQGAGALLEMDIDAVAGSVGSVHRVKDGKDLEAVFQRALQATRRQPERPGSSQVSTIIVPHDVCFAASAGDAGGAAEAQAFLSQAERSAAAGAPAPPTPAPSQPRSSAALEQFSADLAKALRRAPRGKAAVYLGGCAGLADEGVLDLAGRVAAATGAALLCEPMISRLDRGAGRPLVKRLPYFPGDAVAELDKYSMLVLVDARKPVAMFGYENGFSQLVKLQEDDVWEVDGTPEEVGRVLSTVCELVGGNDIVPGKNCSSYFAGSSRPDLPKGKLTAALACQVVAALQPADCVIVDESITSGGSYTGHSNGCPHFSHLSLTGGAIGMGPPLAAGAALACPDRCVIDLQADGSAMYSLQALWTQAREQLKVVTVLFANGTYSILKIEFGFQRITPSNGTAGRALTDLGHPSIDWVAIATGMGVPACRADTCEELAAALRQALSRNGPFLIQANI